MWGDQLNLRGISHAGIAEVATQTSESKPLVIQALDIGPVAALMVARLGNRSAYSFGQIQYAETAVAEFADKSAPTEAGVLHQHAAGT